MYETERSPRIKWDGPKYSMLILWLLPTVHFLLSGPSTLSRMSVYFDQCLSKLTDFWTDRSFWGSSTFIPLDRPLWTCYFIKTMNPLLSKVSGSATWHILSTNIQFIILTIVICIHKLFSVNCLCPTQDHICGWFHSFRLNESLCMTHNSWVMIYLWWAIIFHNFLVTTRNSEIFLVLIITEKQINHRF